MVIEIEKQDYYFSFVKVWTNSLRNYNFESSIQFYELSTRLLSLLFIFRIFQTTHVLLKLQACSHLIGDELLRQFRSPESKLCDLGGKQHLSWCLLCNGRGAGTLNRSSITLSWTDLKIGWSCTMPPPPPIATMRRNKRMWCCLFGVCIGLIMVHWS